MTLTDDERELLSYAMWPVDPPDDDSRSLAYRRTCTAVEAILSSRVAAVEALAVDLRMESWHNASYDAAEAQRDASERIIAALASVSAPDNDKAER